MRRPIILLALATVAFTACGSDDTAMPENAFPIVANADLAVGSQRLLVGLVSQDTTSYAAPDLPVVIDLYPPEADTPSISIPGVFTWTAPEIRGLYRAQVEFDQAGIWSIVLRGEDGSTTDATPFNVAETGVTVAVGDSAPSVETPTGDQVSDLSEISTDPDPDPRFYEISLDQALTTENPTVVVFATPAFCETATCGPMLDTVKSVSIDHPDVNFIHVEVYKNLNATSREDLELVEAVNVWNLPSEPWTFLIGSDGTVQARFEGTIDQQELQEAMDTLS